MQTEEPKHSRRVWIEGLVGPREDCSRCHHSIIVDYKQIEPSSLVREFVHEYTHSCILTRRNALAGDTQRKR